MHIQSTTTMKIQQLKRKVANRFLDAASQIDNGHIRHRNTECHSSKLAVQLRNNFSNSLGCSSWRRNDVGCSSASTTPVLGRRAVDGLLCGCVRMYCRHQTFNNLEVVINHFCQRRQTVCCARSIAITSYTKQYGSDCQQVIHYVTYHFVLLDKD